MEVPRSPRLADRCLPERVRLPVPPQGGCQGRGLPPAGWALAYMMHSRELSPTWGQEAAPQLSSRTLPWMRVARVQVLPLGVSL